METDELEKERTHSYRLRRIDEIREAAEKERDERAALSNKYRRIVSAIDALNTVLAVTAVGFGASGIAVFSTVITPPIALTLGGIALAAAPLMLVSAQVNKTLSLKKEKHEKIKILAEAKLISIGYLVSKALIDGYVSDEEFSLILRELEKFNEKKEEIRAKIKKAIDEEKNRSLISRWKSRFSKDVDSK